MPGGGIGRHKDLKSLEGNFVPVQVRPRVPRKFYVYRQRNSKIIDRKSPLFDEDVELYKNQLEEEISNSTFLLSEAGSIGRQVTKQILKRSKILCC